MIGNRTPPFTAMTAAVTPVSPAPVAAAENSRPNNSVVADAYAVQHQAGHTTDIKGNPAFQFAAQRQTSSAIIPGCRNTVIGVWLLDSPDRSEAVAVYGQPT